MNNKSKILNLTYLKNQGLGGDWCLLHPQRGCCILVMFHSVSVSVSVFICLHIIINYIVVFVTSLKLSFSSKYFRLIGRDPILHRTRNIFIFLQVIVVN